MSSKSTPLTKYPKNSWHTVDLAITAEYFFQTCNYFPTFEDPFTYCQFNCNCRGLLLNLCYFPTSNAPLIYCRFNCNCRGLLLNLRYFPTSEETLIYYRLTAIAEAYFWVRTTFTALEESLTYCGFNYNCWILLPNLQLFSNI